MKAAVRAAPRSHSRVTQNNTPGILPTTEGEQRRPRPSTGEGLSATSEGDRKRRKKEDSELKLTKAEQERVNEFRWTRARSSKGGRLTRTAQQATEGGHKRARDELAANVYHILADEEDEQLEVFKPSMRLFAGHTDYLNRTRVESINEGIKKRNEKRRIAREERDKRISARIERKKEKQELRRAATMTKKVQHQSILQVSIEVVRSRGE